MENKKVIKIGRLSFGISLIVVGLIIIVATFSTLDILRFMLVFFPLILIITGCEIIYYSRKEEVLVKYDILGIILTFFVICGCFIFSLVNYGINKILYDVEINEQIKEYTSSKSYKTSIINLNNVIIRNNNESNIELKIIKNEDNNNNIITISGKLKNEKNGIINILDNNESTIKEIIEINYDKNEININDLVNNYEDVLIKLEVQNDFIFDTVGKISIQ